MKTFQHFSLDDVKVEERRSLLPKTIKRVKSVKVARVSPAWPGLTVAAVLFVWWTWFVISDLIRSGNETINPYGDKYYDFDEVWRFLFCPWSFDCLTYL